jgi:hypothetical protein
MVTFRYVEETSTCLCLSISAASCHNFCGSGSMVACRRSSSHSLLRFSAITSLLTRDGTSKLRQFPALERWVLKHLVLKREERFTMPLPFEVHQSLLNSGIPFGQEDAMLESRLPSPAAPRRISYRFPSALGFVGKWPFPRRQFAVAILHGEPPAELPDIIPATMDLLSFSLLLRSRRSIQPTLKKGGKRTFARIKETGRK